jgi:hypothetical protein
MKRDLVGRMCTWKRCILEGSKREQGFGGRERMGRESVEGCGWEGSKWIGFH